MTGHSEQLCAAKVETALETCVFGRSIELLENCSSTNDKARQAAIGGARNGHVVVANAQSAGRGTHGRRWSSPPGQDLYFSIAWRPEGLDYLPPVSLAVGLGLAHAIGGIVPRETVEIKWPNDLWIQRRKCAGVLVESSTGGPGDLWVVIGVGLNVNRRVWPEELAQNATSLAAHTGANLTRETVLAECLLHIEAQTERLRRLGAAAIASEVEPLLALRGDLVMLDGAPASLQGLSPDGGLKLRFQNETRTVYAGRLQHYVPP